MVAAEMGFGLSVRNRVSTIVISMTYAGRICAGQRMFASFDRSTNTSAAQIKCGGFWEARQLPRVSQTPSRTSRYSACGPIAEVDKSGAANG